MGGKPTTSRRARKRTLRRNAAAAFVGHRDSRVSSVAGSSGAEFVHVARSAFISTTFFDAPTTIFRSPLVLRCTGGGKRPEWTADVQRAQLPALRHVPLSAEQLEFLVERMGAEVRGVECDGVTPRQLLRAVRERFTCFQPTYFHFRPPSSIQEGAHSSSSFFAHIRKLFVPERTFVFLPTGRLQCGVEELRDAVLAVLLVEKDRPLNCVRPLLLISRDDEAASGVADVFPADEQPEKEAEEEDGLVFSVAPEFDELRGGHSLRRRAAFVLAEPEIRVLLVVKGEATAAGLLRRAARTARRFHALLRRLPTVELSEVVLVADLPPADWNDGADGELPDGDYERTSGVIGDLRADRTATWFAELCAPADTFVCETVDRRHRFWFVQRTQGVEEEQQEEPLEPPPDERVDEKPVQRIQRADDQENPWSSDQTGEPLKQLEPREPTAADRAEKPAEDDLWSSAAPPVDLAAELEARLVAAMDAEGIRLPEAVLTSTPKEPTGAAASSQPIDWPKSRGSPKKADKRKKKRSKPSH
ncbi:hypothetical protein M3Y99_00833300 [Aphelenchoides fujianensis]|nr:hypothetical protein M3Y99_00833300 [Aphelenchoides fujianensis]